MNFYHPNQLSTWWVFFLFNSWLTVPLSFIVQRWCNLSTKERDQIQSIWLQISINCPETGYIRGNYNKCYFRIKIFDCRSLSWWLMHKKSLLLANKIWDVFWTLSQHYLNIVWTLKSNITSVVYWQNWQKLATYRYMLLSK